MLMAVAELASAQGKDGAGETEGTGLADARRPGAGPATPGTRSLLAAAILAIFPLVSFAQVQQQTIDYGNAAVLSDTDGSNVAAATWQLTNNGLLDISPTQAGSSIVSLAGSGSVLLGGQTLSLSAAQDVFAGVVFGSGGLLLQGGNEILTGTNTYTGATIINAGTLALAGSGSIALSNGVVDNGAFDVSMTNSGAQVQTLAGAGSVVLGGQTLTLSNAHDVFFGNVNGSGGLAVSGGVETLAGINGYTGATTIGPAGTLSLVALGNIAQSSGVVDNGLLDITTSYNGGQIQSLSGSGSVALGMQTLSLANAHDVFAGTVNGAGGLNVAGGSETLTGTNSYTGATTIGQAGTLALAGQGSIAQSGGVSADGVFDISATSNGAQIQSLSGVGTVNLGGQTLTLTNAGASTTQVVGGIIGYPIGWDPVLGLPYPFPYPYPPTIITGNGGADFAGTIAGSGGLTVAGGTEYLSGVNTYTGATSIGMGATLGLSGSGGIALSSSVADNGTLDLTTSFSGAQIQSLSGSGSVVLGTQTLTLTNAADVFAGTMSGAGGLTVNGGTETLNNAQTYTGATNVGAAGTLALAGQGSIAQSSGVAADGVFDISATSNGAQIQSLSGSGSVLLGGQTLTLTNAGASTTQVVGGIIGYPIGWDPILGYPYPYPFPYPYPTTVISGNGGADFAGTIAGSGGLTIAGGIEQLSGINTYTGATTVNMGATLDLAGSGSIALSSSVADYGTLDITATNNGAQIQSLSGSGSVLLGGQTLTLTNAADVFAGTLSGAGGLAVNGGTETLNNAQTYTGATNVGAAGTLALAGQGSVAQSSGVAADGVFDISATGNGAQIQSLSGSGSVILGGQTLTLTNAGASTTQTQTVGGVVGYPIGWDPVFGLPYPYPFPVISTVVSSSPGAEFSGNIAGSGGLTIAGGTEDLSGINTYTGATTVNMGATLGLAGSGSIALSSSVVDDGVLDVSATSNGAQIQSLSGSGSVLLGGQTLTLTNAADVFAGSINGSGGLAVSGGAQTLAGYNGYTGATAIGAGGTLTLAGPGSIAQSSGVADNGVLDVAASYTGAQIQSLSGSGSVLLGAQTLTLTHAGDSFAGTIAGSGGLTVAGGSETLAGANTYTGATTIGAATTLALAGQGGIAQSSGVADDGVLDISATGNGAQIQSLSGSGSVILGGQTLTLTNAGATSTQVLGGGIVYPIGWDPVLGLPFPYPFPPPVVVNSTGADFSGSISGSGGLAVAGGTEQLSGLNTYTGATSIGMGATLGLAGAGSIAQSSGVADNGVFDVSASNNGAQIQSLSGSGSVLLGGQTLTLTHAGDSFAGTISGAGGLAVSGGSQTLGGSNTYTGATTIGSGETLALAGQGSIAQSSGVADDGVFDIAATDNGAQVRTLSGSGSVVLGCRTLTLTNAAGTFAGTIDGGCGGLAVAGGAETLTGTNTYTGATTIATDAVLALAGSGSIALSSGLADNGVFDIAAAGHGAQLRSLSGSGSVLLGGQTLTLTQADGVFAGSINGSGGLALAGGVETLAGSTGYTGATTIGQGGTLALAGAASIAASSAVVNDGTLDIAATTGDAAVKTLSGSGSVILGGQTLTLTDAAGSFGGTISGSGGLAIASGIETLSGHNSYSGSTVIGQGATLALAGAGSIANSRVNDAGTLDISAAAGTASIKSLAGSGAVLLGGNTLTLSAAGDSFGGHIAGSGGLSLTSGTETLTAAQAYTGTTTIGGGATLALAGAGSIGASAVADAGVLDIAGAAGNVSIRSLSGAGALKLGGNTLTLSDAAGQFGGVISGSGGLNVNGGTATLSGINSYTGKTSVNGATLTIASALGLGTGQDALALNDGTLHTTASLDFGRAIALTGQGTLDVAAGTTMAQSGAVSGSGTLVKNGDGLLTMSGVLSNGGGLKVGQGTLALSGVNTYAGGTTIGSGATLRINSDANLGAAAGKLAFDGGTLQTTGSLDSARAITVSALDGHVDALGADSVVTLNGNISGAGRLYKDGDGTLVLAGDNAGGKGSLNQAGDGWTGGLTVNGGVVKVTNPYGLGWGSVMTFNSGTINATVDILTGQAIQMGHDTSINTDSGTTTTLAGVLTSSDTGNGCFTKTGSGTLNVTGTASIDTTCVAQGKLLANGSFTSKVTVAPGATLGGAGHIQGDVQVLGTLSPGNSPGMLTADATVTMATGSTFKEDIGGSQQASASSPIGATGYYSYLHVTGTKQFVIQPGSTLAPALKDLYSPTESGYGSAPVVPTVGQSYRIITADGGIVGRFDKLVQPDGMDGTTRMAAFYDYGGSNSIELKVLPASYATWLTGGNKNSRKVAAALDRIADLDLSGQASAQQDQLLYSVASYDPNKLGTLSKDMSGEVHGALAAAAPQAGWNLQRSVLKRDAADNGRALWIDIGASHGIWHGDRTASGFDDDAVQITVGGDLLHTADLRVGVGASRANTNLSAEAGSGTLHQNKVFAYGEAAAAGLVFDGIGSYGRDKVDSSRSDPFSQSSLLRGHADGSSAMLGAGVRAPLEVSGNKVESFARVTVQKVERDAFAETPDALAALSLDRFSATGTRIVTGVSGASHNTDPLQASTWRFNLGAGVDAGPLARPAVGAALAQTGTTIVAPDSGRGFVQGGVSGTLQMKKGAYLYFGVTGEARSGYSQLGGNGGVRVVF